MIYSGWGGLTYLLFFLAITSFDYVPELIGCKNNDWILTVMTSAAAAAISTFFLGKLLNKNPLELLEVHDGEAMLVKAPRHTTFSLPMEHAGILAFVVVSGFCIFQNAPKLFTGSPDLQNVRLADLAAGDVRNKPNLKLSDFRIGSKYILVEQKESKNRAYLPLFPSGQSDDVSSCMVVATKYYDSRKALHDLVNQATISGVIINHMDNVIGVQNIMATRYPGSNPNTWLVLDMDEYMPSYTDIALLLGCTAGGLIVFFVLRKKDANRWPMEVVDLLN